MGRSTEGPFPQSCQLHEYQRFVASGGMWSEWDDDKIVVGDAPFFKDQVPFATKRCQAAQDLLPRALEKGRGSQVNQRRKILRQGLEA